MLQGPELDLMSESFSDEFGNPDGYSHKLIYLQWNLHKMNFGTPLQWSKTPSCYCLDINFDVGYQILTLVIKYLGWMSNFHVVIFQRYLATCT